MSVITEGATQGQVEEQRRQQEEAQRQAELLRQQQEAEKRMADLAANEAAKRQEEAQRQKQLEEARRQAEEAAAEARKLYDETMSGQHGEFNSPGERQAFDDAAQELFRILDNPDSSSAMVAMAILTFNKIAASVGERLKTISHGGVVMVTPREADKLEEMGCTLKVYVDKNGEGMVNIYDQDGNLIAKVTELTSADYVEKKADEQGVDYDRFRAGKSIELQQLEWVNKARAEQKEFLEDNEAIGLEKNTGEYMPKEELELLKKQDPDLYDILKKQGYETYKKAFDRKYAQVGGVYFEKKVLEDLKKNDSEMFSILSKFGFAAYQKAIKERQEKQDKDYKEKLEQLLHDDWYLYTVLKTQGYDAYLKAVEKRNQALNNTQMTYDEAIKFQNKILLTMQDYKTPDGYNLVKYFQENPGIEEADKLKLAGFNGSAVDNAYQYAHSLDLLEPYKKGKGYDLRWAWQDAAKMNAATSEAEYLESKELMGAIDLLFSDVDISKVSGGAKIEDTSAWGRGYQAVSVPLAGVAAGARGTPMPQDDAIITGLIVVGAALTAGYYTLKDMDTPKKLRIYNNPSSAAAIEALNSYEGRWNEFPGAENVAFVSDDKGATAITFLDPKTLQPLAGLTPLIVPQIKNDKVELIPPQVKGAGSELKPPKVSTELEQLIPVKPEATILITPKIDLRAYTNVLNANAQVKVAERGYQESEKTFKQILGDIHAAGEVDKYIKERASKGTSQEAASEATRLTIQEFNRKYNIGRYREVVSNYINDYYQYLRQVAAYDNARSQFVAVLYPQPIGGKLDNETLSLLAGSILIRDFKKGKKVALKKGLAEVLDDEMAPVIRTGLAAYNEALRKELQKGKALTAAQLKADTALKNALEAEVKEALELKTATRERIKTGTAVATRTATQTLAKIQAKVATQTAVMTSDLSRPMTREMVNARVGEMVNEMTKPILPPGGGASDKKKREAIKSSMGAVTYRRGKLQHDVWHTYYVDGDGTLHRTVVQGAPPEGATVATGKGSAIATLKKISGKKLPNFTVISDTGAIDDKLTSQSGKLQLTHIPDSISGGRMRITKGSGRISPRMPRLR